MASFKINAAGKQIFLDVFNTPSSVLPASEIPAEILKRFEAAGMPIVLEKGVTQVAFAESIAKAYTALGLSYRNRVKVQPIVPEFSFDFEETEETVAIVAPAHALGEAEKELTDLQAADVLTNDIPFDGFDDMDDLPVAEFTSNGLEN